MQLLEAIVMLLLGGIIGVLCTVFDVALVGSAVIFTRFTLWVLLNVVFATHVRNRWRATWWSIPLNLGLVESYLLCTSFSFVDVSRKLMVPIALLAIIAPLVVDVAWMVRHERRNLFGRLLGVVFVLVILGVSMAFSHGLKVGNVVCALLCLLFMFFVPTHTIAVVQIDGDNHVVRSEGEGVAHHEPRERVNAGRQMQERRARKQARQQGRGRKAAGQGSSAVTARRADAPTTRQNVGAERASVATAVNAAPSSSGKAKAAANQGKIAANSARQSVRPDNPQRVSAGTKSHSSESAPVRTRHVSRRASEQAPKRSQKAHSSRGGRSKGRPTSRPTVSSRQRPVVRQRPNAQTRETLQSNGRQARQGQVAKTSKPHKRQGFSSKH